VNSNSKGRSSERILESARAPPVFKCVRVGIVSYLSVPECLILFDLFEEWVPVYIDSHKLSQGVRLQIRLQRGLGGLARSDEPFYGFLGIKPACREFSCELEAKRRLDEWW
jgi:hypothetical protein